MARHELLGQPLHRVALDAKQIGGHRPSLGSTLRERIATRARSATGRGRTPVPRRPRAVGMVPIAGRNAVPDRLTRGIGPGEPVRFGASRTLNNRSARRAAWFGEEDGPRGIGASAAELTSGSEPWSCEISGPTSCIFVPRRWTTVLADRVGRFGWIEPKQIRINQRQMCKNEARNKSLVCSDRRAKSTSAGEPPSASRRPVRLAHWDHHLGGQRPRVQRDRPVPALSE
jgi:hypothetical protein